MSVSGIGTKDYAAAYSAQTAIDKASENTFVNTLLEKADVDNSASYKTDYNQRALEAVGANAPESVRQAWLEAAEEVGANGLGMLPNGMLSHISQLQVQRGIAWMKGEADCGDVLGASVESAIAAVRKAIYDLDNPLEPRTTKSIEVQRQLVKEREFYVAFLEKLEKLGAGGKSIYNEKSQDSFWERKAERKQSSEEQYEEFQEVTIYAEKAVNKNEVSDSDTQEKEIEYQQFIQEYMEKIFIKLENGETEESYQIGGSSFTIKEWEEFLDKFDSIEEAIRELMEEEQEKKEAEETQKENMVIDDTGTLLTTASTSCRYETADPDDDIRYITWYTEEGIFCRRAGQTEGYEWSIAFKDKEQYDKVMEFIGQFPSDWNLRFAAHENFWNDFLNDEIDLDGFMEFINGTNKGVPDFSVTVGDSMYVDSDKVQWAKYTNPLGTRFYTAEEMHRMQMEMIAANKAKLKKLTDWDAYEADYKKTHPEYNGEKICCEYPGGPLYTVKEMAQLQYRKMLENM